MNYNSENRFSLNISQVKPSMTVGLNARVQELIKNGQQILNFTVGEPDFKTPGIIVDAAIDSLHRGRTKYGAAGGSLALREQIAQKLQNENKLPYAAADIVVGIGAKEILFHTILAITNPGDKIILLAPYWLSYADQIRAAGGTPVILEPKDFLHPEQIDWERLSDSLTSAKAIVLNSPNNPAGFMYDRSIIENFARILSKSDAWIISDEIYEYLNFDGDHISLLNICPELSGRFIHVSGLSKGYFMTGWRVGYCASQSKELVSLVRSLQSHSSTCLPAFIEDASICALKSGRKLVENELAIMRKRRDIGKDFLDRHGISYVNPAGAFYFLMDVRPRNSMKVCEGLLERCQVALVPGEAFGYPGFVRLSYAQPEEVVLEGLRRIAKFLAESA